MRDEDFAAGSCPPHFLDRRMAGDGGDPGGRRRTVALIAAALAAYERAGRQACRGAAR